MKTVGELTLQELEALIDRAVERNLERDRCFQHLVARPHDPQLKQKLRKLKT